MGFRSLNRFLLGHGLSREEMFIDGGEFILYGDFSGDQRVVIEKTSIKQMDPRNKGDFVKPVSSELCAPSVRLRKLGPNRFRFGCGWCNGG
jgi:hypothetical protein